TGTFRLYTSTAVYRYQIFAVNVVDPSDDTYQVGFINTQAFATWGSWVRIPSSPPRNRRSGRMS
ncbi:MAG: hypothetical protein IJ087_13625, partial [Eggerthellaceae bacterium]|nr:hypothetical protein [Eggerthellaceae bacterium]